MSFAFNPLTDEEINVLQNRHLLPDGIYHFFVKNIEQQQSRVGNPMLKVTLGVVAKPGDQRNIIDFLLTTEQMMFKLKHFCESIGLSEQYAQGKFELNDCINRSGKVKIGVQKGAAKDDGSGFFPDKNCVKDYVKPENVMPKVVTPAFKDDDISF